MTGATASERPLFPEPTGEFFRSRWVVPPPGTEQLDPCRLPAGFRAGAAACGLKGSGASDVGVIACDDAAVRSAILLTENASAAAPVRVCREECDGASIRAVIVNSGNANAATGAQGMRDALAMQACAADQLGLEPRRVAVAETGTIGVPLPLPALLDGIPAACSTLAADGAERFAEAIMTTDRTPKRCAVRCGGVTVSAQAKGAGMIEPGFATMLCFVQTDAAIAEPDETLRSAARRFERISVDGQMSTNDTVLLQATGSAGLPLPDGLLEAVLGQLALEIVADGEGATRVCRIEVREAANAEEAERVARAIANSPLVKTSLFGRDPNWGRIAQTAGQALAGEQVPELGPERIDASELADEVAEAEIELRLGRGDAEAHLYFSDLNYDYVRINAEYTS